METLENKIRMIERAVKCEPVDYVPSRYRQESSVPQSIQLELVLERLRRLEETVDSQRPVVTFPTPSPFLADVEELRTEISEKTDKRLKEVEERLHAMLSDGIEKISVVLRKLVAVQKSIAGR